MWCHFERRLSNDRDSLGTNLPTSLDKNQGKELSSHGAECNMGNIFRVSHILQQIVAKNGKWGKYLPILHEAMCDNYYIVKCLLKSNLARVI